MNLKKRIIGLVCCLAVMGMFSVSGLTSEAAQCTHPGFISGEACQDPNLITASGHYEVWGTEYKCIKCGYSYWENLHNVKTGEHIFLQIGTDVYGLPIYSDYCAVCGYQR